MGGWETTIPEEGGEGGDEVEVRLYEEGTGVDTQGQGNNSMRNERTTAVMGTTTRRATMERIDSMDQIITATPTINHTSFLATIQCLMTCAWQRK
jgi:hypothetical protein